MDESNESTIGVRTVFFARAFLFMPSIMMQYASGGPKLPRARNVTKSTRPKKKNFKRRLSHSNVNRTQRAKSYNDLIGNLQKFIDT